MTPSIDIASAGPLEHVWIGEDLSFQVQHAADAPDYEFFPQDIFPADAGTFVAVGGLLYAPDFFNHDSTAAGFNLGAYVPFTPVSQTALTGDGTASDPYKVITVVDAAITGLRIQQTDTYVIGDAFFTTKIVITNTSGTTKTGVLYRAGDAFMGGGDTGYGWVDALSGGRYSIACTENADNAPPGGKVIQFYPLTDANNYMEGQWDDVWAAVATLSALPNTAPTTTLLDNGCGISWDFSIPDGESATYSLVTAINGPYVPPEVVPPVVEQPAIQSLIRVIPPSVQVGGVDNSRIVIPGSLAGGHDLALDVGDSPKLVSVRRDGTLLDTDDKLDGLRETGSTLIAWSHGLTTSMLSSEMGFTSGGGIFAVMINIPRIATLTGAAFLQTTQGVYTAASYNGLALYQFDQDTEQYILIAQTPDEPDLWKQIAGTPTKEDFVTPVTVQPGNYWLVMIHQGTDAVEPKIAAAPDVINSFVSNLDSLTGMKTYQGVDTTGVTDPPSVFGTYTSDVRRPWLALY